ncbi:large conductance mechanosensitive channel protein MscL [Verrucomicrobiaceae bacterium R5-34]|uniref:Large-conductance mechanosensitive channel n=1 Tax=Oceaniferula flava TaxID=2800421 RepID=A0AAE2SCE7_9BACT|nr:large conductance mechanosensitive channel protein MscL [Oceaniferula flavus]MBK1831973.1 large conductance mechanosensitive channel protein MscL [Verrucomicrobiaceae bacterium R5-34]MBK1855259.1 large conductance mechanosensitive channel protein MscL [Oceaniferula flavus]MBM1136565.1 large conductance mechanosensitive channel protein MscL [Oceaniferula flavus]
MLKDFKNFIIKGNAFDMAVGIILGGAFGLVVKSLVDNVMMPIIGGAFKLPDFSQMYYAMDGGSYENLKAAQEAGPTVAYGLFINNTINLLIVGFALFVMVKYIEKATKKKEEEKPAPAPPKQEVLLEEIRDLLKK